MNNRNIERTKKLAMIAMFSALAYVTTVICKLIPDVAGFLSLEIKDAVIVLFSLMFVLYRDLLSLCSFRL